MTQTETPSLIFETKTTHYVSDTHLERFLEAVIGKRYEIIGSNNDTDYTETIVRADHVSTPGNYGWRESEEDIAEFLEDDYIDLECGSFGPALQYCADKGLIPYGSYVVRVSW